MAAGGEGFAQYPMAAAGWNHPKLFDVNMHQLAWLLSHIAQRPPGDAVEVTHAAERNRDAATRRRWWSADDPKAVPADVVPA